MSLSNIIKNKKFIFFYTGNLLGIAIALATQLIIPKLITIEQFGLYKTFTLYLGYTSLLHFGFKDGLYVWFCQNPRSQKITKEILSAPLFIQQIGVFIIILLISLFFEGQIKLLIISLAFATVFNIINTFFDSYYQSAKIFKPTVYLKIFSELSLLGLVILFYKLKIQINGILLIETGVAISMISFLLYWIYAKWNFFRFNQILGFRKIVKDIYLKGFHLLIGNLSHQLSSNIDKLFISFFYNSIFFGFYAFGATFFVLANVALSSISTFILPYLFKENNNNDNLIPYEKFILYPLKLIPVYILYFIAVVFFITHFYSEYQESIKYFSALNLALVLNISISIVQNNFLKSLGLEKIYSKSNVIILFSMVLVFSLIHLLSLNFILISIVLSLSFLTRYLVNDYHIRKKLNLKLFNMKSVLWLVCNIVFYIIALFWSI